MRPTPRDLRHVHHWIFDLDNTLYPPECELFALIDERMTRFIADRLALTADEALRLQKRYYHDHGTTLAGLMAHHGMDPHDFLDFVHDISLDRLQVDTDLVAAIARLPGDVYIFTNGSQGHGERVCAALGLRDHIQGIFSIESSAFIPKPQPEAFESFLATHPLNPNQAAMFEDLAKNLRPAYDLGMTTVLVGDHALGNTDAHVQWRTPQLAPFLQHLTGGLA